MSQAPRNPFDTGNDQFEQPAAQQGSNAWMWVLGIVGGLILVSMITCCGVGFYLWNSASGMLTELVVEEYADDPIVVEKIGTITESSVNFSEAVSESSKDEDISAMVFDVKGDRGSGKIIQRTNIETGEETAVLIMENGQEFELEVNDEFEEYEMEFSELEDLETIEGAPEEQPGETADEVGAAAE